MKKKNNPKIWYPILAIILVLVIAVNGAAVAFDSFVDHYLGGNPYDIITVEGSENWDTEYYTQSYAAKEDATSAAQDFLVELAGEGIVMMKNDNK